MSDERSLSEVLADTELEKLAARIIADLNDGQTQAAQAGVQTLLRAQKHQQQAAVCLLQIVSERLLSYEQALTVLAEIHAIHSQDEEIVAGIGCSLDRARDIDLLNAAPPRHPLFAAVVGALAKWSARAPTRTRLLEGLATAARMMARQQDALAESAYRRLIELEPDVAGHHYNLGLLCKTRGHFREGMEANQAAARLQRAPDEATQWNLGICATGAGEGAVALAVWKDLEQVIEMGRFGLPEGGYEGVKVRLAEHPLAERTAGTDHPGLEETIWVERLSPCHGIVRNVLYRNLGVDYGDVVLFDGAPITHHTYGDRRVPVFPHLATLVRRRYQLFDFAGTQREPQQLADASTELAGDTVIYSHTENIVMLCEHCWRDPDGDHSHHAKVEKRMVMGQIAAPPDMEPRELLSQLDAAIARREGCHLYVPDLCRLAGFPERADVEGRRLEMIRQAVS